MSFDKDIEKQVDSAPLSPVNDGSTLDKTESSSSDTESSNTVDDNEGAKLSWRTWIASFWTPRHPEPIKVRCVKDFERGYPNLATYQNSSENFAIYRRFGYLQSRLLLDKQDELRILEERLDQFDHENTLNACTRALSQDEIGPRNALLKEIEDAFNSYAAIMSSSQQMQAFNRPTAAEYRSLRDYIECEQPIHEREEEYIQHKEDLVTLRPGRDHAWLDRSIEHSLHALHKPFPFLHGWFCSRETKMKSRDGPEIYYTPERINLLASFIITLMIVAMLIVPIYLLYTLVSKTGGDLDRQSAASCIGILLVFTLLFSAILSLFTRAKRHEILAAAAGYCAVLVVFLGNVPN